MATDIVMSTHRPRLGVGLGSMPRCRSEDTAHSFYRVRVTAHMCGVPIGTPHIVLTGSGTRALGPEVRDQESGPGPGVRALARSGC